jgi:hypothetical protein
MRSALAADLDCEQSLEAMRHAFRASKFARRKYVEIDAGVVHALLNARYYESARRQFISQDPSFLALGDPNKVNQITGLNQRAFLSDPQLANSYNYGRDNPIVRKDPDGNNPVALAFAIGGTFVGVYNQLQYDLDSGQTSSVPQYVAAGLKGAATFAVAGAAVSNPLTVGAAVLRLYSAYDTAVNAYNFGNQVLVNDSRCGTAQRLQATDNLYIDLGGRAIGIAVPKQYAIIYDALRTIYDSLGKVDALRNQLQTNSASTQNSVPRSVQGTGGANGSASQTSANNGGWGSAHTACGTLCR